MKKPEAGRGKKKSGNGVKLAICILTLINFILGILLKIHDRKEIIRAVEGDDQVKTLLITEKTTREL